jgi:hypothetical protein
MNKHKCCVALRVVENRVLKGMFEPRREGKLQKDGGNCIICTVLLITLG